MHEIILIFFSLALTLSAVARSVIVDNVSPQVVFSPPPCFQNDVDGCSLDWQLRDKKGAFNGSVTLTSGTNSSLGFPVLSRVSLVFEGTCIVFMPGMHSTAQASVVVDDRASVLLNTSQSAFAATGLDPTQNHTISITFVPSNGTTTLDVDYFQITQPDEQTTSTSTSTSSFFTTALPTILPTTTPVPSSALSQPTIPTGTIAAVSLSGGLVIILGVLVCFCAARRRRRRAAIRRERAILYDLHLPSERQRRSWRDSAPWMRWRTEAGDNTLPRYADPKEKGKAREQHPPPPPSPSPPPPRERPESELLEWRIASPPPASLRVGRAYSADYTPWP